MPPYYVERFRFRTASLPQAERTYVMIDLRPFVWESRVFALVPKEIIRPERLAEIQQGTADSLDGVFATVPAKPDDYNAIFGESLTSSIGADTVLVELTPRKRAILDLLQLAPEAVSIEIHYAVLRESVWPKTQYMIHFAQFVDGFPVGEFEHLFQAYHPFDIPIIGDRRNKVAYRRSSWEVSEIPPLALEFFDTWVTAAAYGYNPAPRSYGKHFKLSDVSRPVVEGILEFFNDKKLTADAIVQIVQDNPLVDATGKVEKKPTKKKGIRRSLAQKIIDVRKELPDGRFRRLQQIDAIKGVGPDTMSDIITTFFGVGGRNEQDDARWYPSEEIVALLKQQPTQDGDRR